jgi:hypothetical protein
MVNEGGDNTKIISQAEEVSVNAQLDIMRREATRRILGIPSESDISDEELDNRWKKHLYKIDDLRGKWNVPPGEDPVDYLMKRLEQKFGDK